MIWSAQGIAVKFLSPFLGPIAITFVPFYVTTLLFVPLLIRLRKQNPGATSPTARDWVSFPSPASAARCMAQLGMTWGINKSLASNGSILNLLIPVISAVLASFMLKEKLDDCSVSCRLAIGLVGVVFLSVGDFRQASFGSMKYLAGNLLIFAGCLGSSFYNVYCKGLMARFQEIEILIYSYMTASLASIPLLIWVEPFHFRSLLALDGKGIAAFLFLAFFMYGASMLLFFKALQHLDVTTASMSLLSGTRYLAYCWPPLLLGEHLSPASLVGTAIVLISTILVVRYDTSY